MAADRDSFERLTVMISGRVGVRLILCTSLAGAGGADLLAKELGIPVLDSVTVAVRHSLTRLEVVHLEPPMKTQPAGAFGNGSFRTRRY